MNIIFLLLVCYIYYVYYHCTMNIIDINRMFIKIAPIIITDVDTLSLQIILMLRLLLSFFNYTSSIWFQDIIDEYYVVQLISEPYTLQEDNRMKDYSPLITSYVGEIVCDAVFLNSVPNVRYWLTPINKGDGNITVRLN